MNCRSASLERFIDLGKQPNGNHYPDRSGFSGEQKFPLAMLVCTDCWQVQIEEFPSPEVMFCDHPYLTGINRPVVDHFKLMVDKTLTMFDLQPGSLVLDIGANDGTLLGIFQEKGMKVLGVDPGQRSGKAAGKAGIHVMEKFWNTTTARELRQLELRPDLITATAVFYHMEDIHDFIQGLKEVMTKETVFMVQCVYLKDVLEKGQFDHFYHEHSMIHSIWPLRRLFNQYGMRLLDIDFYPVHGGSFVLYVGQNDHSYGTSPNILQALEAEKEAGLLKIESYLDFGVRVENLREDLLKLLHELKALGKRVYALGAPVKGATLLNYCGIGPELVELATELNEFKTGRFIPGCHIPIVHEASLKEPPDYYLVLSWNYLDFFRSKYRNYLDSGGCFIVPHPKVRIAGPEQLSDVFP